MRDFSKLSPALAKPPTEEELEAWRKNYEMRNTLDFEEASIFQSCEEITCSKTFKKKKPWQRFCSGGCRDKANNRLKKNKDFGILPTVEDYF